MSAYLREFSTRSTPQSEPLPGQVPNSAGGHAWQVDDFTRLHRFLILGSEGGSYYASGRELTKDNAQAVLRAIAADGPRAVREIVEVSKAGRAPKNDPAVFALALAASHGDEQTRRAALDALPDVCRIGTHLFHFAAFAEQFRGWGRGLRRAVAGWYERGLYDGYDQLVYQVVKYRQRDGWTHRDLLRLSHPTADSDQYHDLYAWITGKSPDWSDGEPPRLIAAYERAQTAATPAETVAVIRDCPDIPREALNPDHLKSPDVWEALLDSDMPMTALIRNLATMTRVGLLAPMSQATSKVVAQINDSEWLRKARVHPLTILVALKTYESGRSARGVGTWQAVPQVIDALDGAFYAAFGNVEPTGKRTMLALDVSGSMTFSEIAGMPGVTPRVGSAAMSLVTAAVEPAHAIVGFTSAGGGGWYRGEAALTPLTISARQRLDDVLRTVDGLPFGGTDCSLPMTHALETGMDIDTFVVYTDSETWAGNIHPSQALTRYRQKTGIDAKLVVVGMVSNGFSIADPNDAGMLDVVGFDTSTPNVIAEFSR